MLDPLGKMLGLQLVAVHPAAVALVKNGVVGMDVVSDPKNQKLIVISTKGYGKMTAAENFPPHKRGGVGVKVAAVTAKTGPIAAVHTLEPDAEEVIMMSTGGQAIRVAVKEIPTLGRATQGVRVMRLNEGDFVASIGIIPKEEEGAEETASEETPDTKAKK